MQCDPMVRLFGQYLANCNSENVPNSIQNCQRGSKISSNNKQTLKLVKFCQRDEIWPNLVAQEVRVLLLIAQFTRRQEHLKPTFSSSSSSCRVSKKQLKEKNQLALYVETESEQPSNERDAWKGKFLKGTVETV